MPESFSAAEYPYRGKGRWRGAFRKPKAYDNPRSSASSQVTVIVAQLVEHNPWTIDVAGSNPAIDARKTERLLRR